MTDMPDMCTRLTEVIFSIVSIVLLPSALLAILVSVLVTCFLLVVDPAPPEFLAPCTDLCQLCIHCGDRLIP